VTVVTTGTMAAVLASPSPRLIVWTRISAQCVDRSSPSSPEMTPILPRCRFKNDTGLNYAALSPVFRLTETYSTVVIVLPISTAVSGVV